MTMPPPGEPRPQAFVPFNPQPTEQQFSVAEGSFGDTKLITLTVVQPLVTHVLLLTHDAARQLADQLFTKANGLHIARDIGPEGRTK